MVTIIVNNSLSKAEGLSLEQGRALREVLSYTLNPQASYFSGARYSNKRYLIDKRGTFPTGLLYLVKKHLGEQKVPYILKDLRKRPEGSTRPFKIDLAGKGLKPYPEQLAAAQACFKGHRGIVCAPTGVGKSVIAALIVQELQVNTLIVVPTLELKTQLTQSLKGFFGTSMAGPLDEKRPIAVENIAALSPDEPLKGYDCVIIDEFHHAGAASYRKLNQKAWNDVYYRFGMTATPFRSQDNERILLESVLAEVIYRIDHITSVKKGYIVPVKAYYYSLPKQELEGNPTSWASVYSELVVNNKYRNDLIASLLTQLKAAGKPTLCLVKEIKHGEILSQLTGVPFANGQEADTRIKILEFNIGEITSLIGTTGVLGEGVDTRPAEYIILAGGGKSKNSFMQQCGRGFRRHKDKESCKVILLKDKSHKWLLQHFNLCVKYLLSEYGIKPKELK